MTLHGATEDVVERAIDDRAPFPGTRGFAGMLSDGRLVRDVLGRYPVFVDADDRTTWGFDPTALDEPVALEAGCVRHGGEERRIWRLSDPPTFDSDAEAIAELGIEIRRAFDRIPTDGVAVAFSGGVDSSVVASALDAPSYVVGFPGSHDVSTARESAALLGIDVRVLELSHESIERAVPIVARATGRTNAMDVSIALALYLVAERVADDGYERLAIGQGADELFGGYEKVARADHRVEADTVRGATRESIASLPEGLERDVLAIRAAGVEPVAPLLDDGVVSTALRLDDALLVREGVRKWAFREAARAFVPDRVAERKKKALQYGSLLARELDRLARRAGYKRRMEDHVSRYIRSLCRG